MQNDSLSSPFLSIWTIRHSQTLASQTPKLTVHSGTPRQLVKFNNVSQRMTSKVVNTGEKLGHAPSLQYNCDISIHTNTRRIAGKHSVHLSATPGDLQRTDYKNIQRCACPAPIITSDCWTSGICNMVTQYFPNLRVCKERLNAPLHYWPVLSTAHLTLAVISKKATFLKANLEECAFWTSFKTISVELFHFLDASPGLSIQLVIMTTNEEKGGDTAEEVKHVMGL